MKAESFETSLRKDCFFYVRFFDGKCFQLFQINQTLKIVFWKQRLHQNREKTKRNVYRGCGNNKKYSCLGRIHY